MIPTPETISGIVGITRNSGLLAEDFIADPHATLIYSKNIVDVSTILLPNIKFPIIGLNPKFEIFDTRDDGLCIVLTFDSDAARAISAEIQSKYSLTLPYGNLNPHITIQKNIPCCRVKMPQVLFSLVFDKIMMDNGAAKK